MYRAHSIIWPEIRAKKSEFIKDIGTMKCAIFAQNGIRKNNKNEADVYIYFIDYENAFNKLHHKDVWTISKSGHMWKDIRTT